MAVAEDSRTSQERGGRRHEGGDCRSHVWRGLHRRLESGQADVAGLARSRRVRSRCRGTGNARRRGGRADGVYAPIGQAGGLDAVSTQQSVTAPASIAVAGETGPGPGAAGTGRWWTPSDRRPGRSCCTGQGGDHQTPSGRPRRAALDGSTADVADGEHGLQVVDLAVPASRDCRRVQDDNPARDAAVGGIRRARPPSARREGPREIKDQEVPILRRTPWCPSATLK